MAWIESHQAVANHPKRLMLSSLMGWDIDTTIGKLHRFWWWCVDYAEDGDLRKYNDSMLGEAVGLSGESGRQFIEAMVTARWLDREPYFRVHDWWDRIGRFLQVKYRQKPEKWSRVRELYKGHPPPADGISKTVSNNTSYPAQPNPTYPTLPNQPNPTRVGAGGAGNMARVLNRAAAGEVGSDGDFDRMVEVKRILVEEAGVCEANASKLLPRRDITPVRVRAELKAIRGDPKVENVGAVLYARLKKT